MSWQIYGKCRGFSGFSHIINFQISQNLYFAQPIDPRSGASTIQDNAFNFRQDEIYYRDTRIFHRNLLLHRKTHGH